MEFKSRIFATSRGSTIDAIGDGKYLVCNPAYCFMVHGLRQAHEAVQRQEKPALCAMAEYRIHCKHCGYEGQANSRWIPFVQVEKRGPDCPPCGRPTLLEPWCRLRAEASMPDY